MVDFLFITYIFMKKDYGNIKRNSIGNNNYK